MAQPFLCNGEWMSSEAKRAVYNPYDDSVIDHVCIPSSEHTQQAIQASQEAFLRTKQLSSGQRFELLNAIAAIIAENGEDLAHTISLEAGKPIRQAHAEVKRAVETFRIGAQAVEDIYGEYRNIDSLTSNRGKFYISSYFPLGPVCAITPFNFPLNLVAHKIAPALGAGNSVILKPASQTPLTALKLALLIEKTGLLPHPSTLQVLPIAGKDMDSILSDHRIRAVSFTGSSSVGWGLRSRIGSKKLTLELGGNAAAIVCADTDIQTAAKKCARGAFAYAGQICISVQRIIVEDSIHDQFLQAFTHESEKLQALSPQEENSDLGPIISQQEANRIKDWISSSIDQGATLISGNTWQHHILKPTTFTNVSHQSELWREEAFAPIAVVESFTSFDQALDLVNDTRFGLQAGLFTNNYNTILKAYQEIDVGGLIINDVPTFRADAMPYGGEKESGLGREGLRHALRELSTLRTMVSTYPR